MTPARTRADTPERRILVNRWGIMGCSALDRGTDGVRAAAPALPLLTSRRHIDLLRVCSAANCPHPGGPAPAHR
ncbi:predicted protein [Streptomyces sp. C]|nr:predicted protein [Streptomyces sp. C]